MGAAQPHEAERTHRRLRLLLVDDEPLVARTMAKALRREANVFVATSFTDARRRLQSAKGWDVLVIDVLLGAEGSGFDLLTLARREDPGISAIMVTGRLRLEFVNQACALGAALVTKPCPSGLLRDLLRGAVSRLAATTWPGPAKPADMLIVGVSQQIEGATLAWVDKYGLSMAEADVLRRAVRGATRAGMAADRGTSENTIRNQIAGVLAKTLDDSLEGAVARLLRDLFEI